MYLTNWAALRAVADLRTKLFDHLQNLSLGFFSHARTGDLISRITNDTQILHNVIGGWLASVVKDPVTLVCLLAVLLYAGADADADLDCGAAGVPGAHYHLRPESAEIGPGDADPRGGVIQPDARMLHRQPHHQSLQPRRHRAGPIPGDYPEIHRPHAARDPGE